ncbi:MAG: ribonuclease III [Deltaproteobacteria bacterium]
MQKKSPTFERLEKTLGYQFKDQNLLTESLIHKSYSYENLASKLKHNERLEFLGDAVLELVVSDLLMEHFPQAAEGELSRLRASIVNETQLATVASKLELGKLIYLGKGEEQTKGRTKNSILANTYEAVLAAIYMDGGYDKVYAVVQDQFLPLIAEAKKTGFDRDYKTRLQEEMQNRYKKIPRYQVKEEAGPDHNKTFRVEVSIKGRFLALGSGKSKKEAEQDAARGALQVLKEEDRF